MTVEPCPVCQLRAPCEHRPAYGMGVLDEVRAWFAIYVLTMRDDDLDILTLWAAHTYLCEETYSTPRLQIDSPIPGSGKTTVLEHFERLCRHPLNMAAISSPALLVRALEKGPRTLLIDEADRTLDPKKDGVGDLIAILNSGYKRGGKRPVLVPGKGGQWALKEMSTFAPVALAGNNPALPDDTKTRVIRVLLLPDLEGRVTPSEWEDIEDDAVKLGKRLAEWANGVRKQVRSARPPLPEGCVGRARERWGPLRRVAEAAGGRWPAVADRLIVADLEAARADRADGMERVPIHVTLLRDLAARWPAGEFWPTEDLLAALVAGHPDRWGTSSPFGKALTAQRLGRMLAGHYKIHSDRQGDSARGYFRSHLLPVWGRMGVRTDGTG
ncbi:DUF3631 domain-containing protein [Pseudonocardia adelaidensis]|uniref:DUF3631 domain-containing protein n=1 Tax=Pseudonocardia adelaidensis TaxID=648754 RepID=A0ABP9NRG2_9PSEU